MTNKVELSVLQQQVLIGNLLGDGHLEKHERPNNNANLRIVRSSQDEKYMVWETEIFKNLITNSGISRLSRFDKRTQKIYNSISYRTKKNACFNFYYKTWYKDKKKIVPKDLKLTPLILAVWLADDGSFHLAKSKKSAKIKKTYKHRLCIKLSTHGFLEEDVDFLQFILSDFTDIKWKKYKDKSGYFLFVSNSNDTRKILKIVDPCFPPVDRKTSKWRNGYLEYQKLPNPICNFCNTNVKVTKNGKRNNKQKYYCWDCKKYVKN